MSTTALIVAAGAGLRMGLPSPKAFLTLAGRPMVEHSLATFDAHPGIDAIILMAPATRLVEASRIASAFGKVREVAAGGERRQDTMKLGLGILRSAIGPGRATGEDLLLVHDAARPLVDAPLIAAVIAAAMRTGAAFPGIAPSDTVRRIGDETGLSGPRFAGVTLDRKGLVLVQTPQGFRLSVLLEACAAPDAGDVTDDVALVQSVGHPVEVVPGSPRNLKITTPGDLEIAEALLARGEVS